MASACSLIHRWRWSRWKRRIWRDEIVAEWQTVTKGQCPIIVIPQDVQLWRNGEQFEAGLYRQIPRLRSTGWNLGRRLILSWRVFIGRYDAIDWGK